MQFGRREKWTEGGSEEGTEVGLFRTGHVYSHTHTRVCTHIRNHNTNRHTHIHSTNQAWKEFPELQGYRFPFSWRACDSLISLKNKTLLLFLQRLLSSPILFMFRGLLGMEPESLEVRLSLCYSNLLRFLFFFNLWLTVLCLFKDFVLFFKTIYFLKNKNYLLFKNIYIKSIYIF